MKTLAALVATPVALFCSSALAQVPLSGPPRKQTIHTPDSLTKKVEEEREKQGNSPKKSESAPPPSTSPTANSSAPNTAEGRYLPKWLLFRDGRMLFGDVLKDSAGYSFRSRGASMRLSSMQVEAVADTKTELFKYKRDRIATNDLPERLELAHWCLRHQMIVEAKAEVKAILSLDPQFDPAKKLAKSLASSDAPATAPGDAKAAGGGIAQDAGAFGDDALRMFTSKVQLILLNKCGSCHANPRHESEFHLYRLSDRRKITPTMTSKNFKAAELMVDLKNPNRSKLLEMAITPHGDPRVQSAAFGGPNDENFKTLRLWAFTLSKNWHDAFAEPDGMPQIAADAPDFPVRRPTAAPKVGKKTEVANKMKPVPDKPGFGSQAADDAPPERPSLLRAPKKAAKPKLPEGDPLDPNGFNETEGTSSRESAAAANAKLVELAPPPPKQSPKTSSGSSPNDHFRGLYDDVPDSWKQPKKAG